MTTTADPTRRPGGRSAPDRRREGVLRPRPDRRGVPDRRCRGRIGRLGAELGELLGLGHAHGEQALLAALARATAFRRWRAEDVRSILAAGAAAPRPPQAGTALVVDLPAVPTRSLADYALRRARVRAS